MRGRPSTPPDQAVSPVIAVILLVMITVVLSATIYVFVSGFDTQDEGLVTAALDPRLLDANGNSANEWIRLTLAGGNSAPYPNRVTTIAVTYGGTALDGTDVQLCTAPRAQAGPPAACAIGIDPALDFLDTAANSPDTDAGQWAIGEVLYVPCQGKGEHTVTVSVRGVAVLDARVLCDEAAA